MKHRIDLSVHVSPASRPFFNSHTDRLRICVCVETLALPVVPLSVTLRFQGFP